MIYLASPYSHKDKAIEAARYRLTAAYVAKLFQEGIRVYSPIVACHHLAIEHRLPSEAAWWEGFNHDLIDRCDEILVLMLDGWEDSLGVQKEIAYATSLGKIVRYVKEE